MSDQFEPERSGSAPPSAAESAADVKRTAEKVTSELAGEVRESVAEGAAQAREAVAARSEDAKQALARQMAATAEALGSASRDLDEQSVQRTLFDEAAKGLSGISRALESRSVGELMSGMADFGRRNPVAFLGGAALAGFALFVSPDGRPRSVDVDNEPGVLPDPATITAAPAGPT